MLFFELNDRVRGNIFCELDGRVVGGMQFGVLVEGHVFWGDGGCCSCVMVCLMIYKCNGIVILLILG